VHFVILTIIHFHFEIESTSSTIVGLSTRNIAQELRQYLGKSTAPNKMQSVFEFLHKQKFINLNSNPGKKNQFTLLNEKQLRDFKTKTILTRGKFKRKDDNYLIRKFIFLPRSIFNQNLSVNELVILLLIAFSTPYQNNHICNLNFSTLKHLIKVSDEYNRSWSLLSFNTKNISSSCHELQKKGLIDIIGSGNSKKLALCNPLIFSDLRKAVKCK